MPVLLNVPRQLELGERACLAADEAAAVHEHVLAEARRRRIGREHLRRHERVVDVDRRRP